MHICRVPAAVSFHPERDDLPKLPYKVEDLNAKAAREANCAKNLRRFVSFAVFVKFVVTGEAVSKYLRPKTTRLSSDFAEVIQAS